MTNPNYSVVLRSDIPARERQLLEHVCSKITSPAGEPLLHFWCTKIDTSHHFYISMDTFKPGDESIHAIQIPHHFVFLISGAEYPKAIGFTASLEGSAP